MKAAVFVKPGIIDVKSVADPEPSANQIRVKLKGCGVCASNLPIWQGRPWFTYPMEPGAGGHEGWGVVDAAGKDVRKFKVGQTVAFLSSHSYAQYDIADDDSAVVIPDSLKHLPFTAEPFGCVMNILARSDIQAGQRVAIVGIGFLGAMLVSLCAAKKAEVIAISRRRFSLEIAKKQGASHILEMGENKDSLVEKIKTITSDNGCERVIEAIGNQQALDIASELTAVRGRLIIAGYHQDGNRQVNMQLWNWRGLDVINAHEREKSMYLGGIQSAIRAVQNNGFRPFDLLTNRYSIEELPKAFEDMQTRPAGFLKGYIQF